MRYVQVQEFGGLDTLRLVDGPTPEPGPRQVRARLTSIGMNQADLLGRRGGYKATTGEPPYVPGIEGGGVIEAVGSDVDDERIGQRVVLGPTVPRGVAGPDGGTCRSHMVVDADVALPAPDALPDDQLGAVILSHFTAHGYLVHRFGLESGRFVGISAASSSVGLAAAQVARRAGALPIGLTSSPDKVDAIQSAAPGLFEHLVVTHEAREGERVMTPWRRQIKTLTDGHGLDLVFDAVAAGPYLGEAVRSLAQGGTICLYGLLGEPGVVDLQPLIIRQGRIETFVLYQLAARGPEVWGPVCDAVFEGFASGAYRQVIAGRFPLDDVQRAHAEMEKGRHVGKFVLTP